MEYSFRVPLSYKWEKMEPVINLPECWNSLMTMWSRFDACMLGDWDKTRSEEVVNKIQLNPTYKKQDK
jgi:hypothetical protein